MPIEPIYARVPTEQMETLIPEGIAYSTTPTGNTIGEGEDASVELRQRTLREFTHPHVTHDLPNGTTVFLCNCNQAPDRGGRIDYGMTEEDIIDWRGYLKANGVPDSDILTQEQYRELLPEVEI